MTTRLLLALALSLTGCIRSVLIEVQVAGGSCDVDLWPSRWIVECEWTED